jgi:hypothetical protein
MYARSMEKTLPQCEIVYVKDKAGKGWKWRSVSASGAVRSSEEVYGLFYDCVVAARAKGYTPTGILPVHGSEN